MLKLSYKSLSYTYYIYVEFFWLFSTEILTWTESAEKTRKVKLVSSTSFLKSKQQGWYNVLNFVFWMAYKISIIVRSYCDVMEAHHKSLINYLLSTVKTPLKFPVRVTQ